MALLRFTDARGVEWDVWEVGRLVAIADRRQPEAAPARRWLCFQSATEWRRLAHYPRRWAAMSPRELDALCRAAEPTPGGVRPLRDAAPRPARPEDDARDA